MALTLRSKKSFVTESHAINDKKNKPVCLKGTSKPENSIFNSERSDNCESYPKKISTKTPSIVHQNSMRTNIKIKERVKKHFQCKVCEKLFTSNSNYERHFMGQHSGMKAFKCNECNYSFSYKDSLSRHLERKESEKSDILLKCSNCDKLYTNYKCLACHMNLVHKLKVQSDDFLKENKKDTGKDSRKVKRKLHFGGKIRKKLVNEKARSTRTKHVYTTVRSKKEEESSVFNSNQQSSSSLDTYDKYHTLSMETTGFDNEYKSLLRNTNGYSLSIDDSPLGKDLKNDYDDIKHKDHIKFSACNVLKECKSVRATSNLRNKPKVVSYEETYSDDEIFIDCEDDFFSVQSTGNPSLCSTPVIPPRPFVSPIPKLINCSPGLPVCYVKIMKLSDREVEILTTPKSAVISPKISYDSKFYSGTKYDTLTSKMNSFPTSREILQKLGLDPFLKSDTNCVICCEEFSNIKDIASHMKTHYFKFKCKSCPKEFRDRLAVYRHFLGQHSGLKIFKCDYCDMSFSYLDTLRGHLRIHLGYNRYHCSYCQEGFLYLDSLKCHISREHTGIKPFICECGKGYATRNRMKPHTSMCKVFKMQHNN